MKKLLALAVCLMLLGTVTVNGTFASDFSISDFFQTIAEKIFGEPKTDSSQLDVETTVKMRGQDGKLVDESEPQMLVPLNQPAGWYQEKTVTPVGEREYKLWTEPGVIDKFICVTNKTEADKGKDAYFRTAISIRCSSETVWNNLKINLNEDTSEYQWSGWKNHGEWYTNVATYLKPLAPGETSPAMMMQLALVNSREMTNELMTTFGSEFTIEMHTVAIDMETFKNSSDDTQMSAMEALDMAAPIQSFLTN